MELSDLLLFRGGFPQSMFTGMIGQGILPVENRTEQLGNKHFQIIACLGLLSNQCAIQQIFAISCLQSGIQRFNDYSSTPPTGSIKC